MSISLDEKTLEGAASNGEFDIEKWPTIFEPLLQRLNEIVYTEFPMPRPYPSLNRQSQGSPTQTQSNATRNSNATPSTPVRNLPPVPPFPNSSISSANHVPDSMPPSQEPVSDALNELPTLLLQILNGVTNTLRSSFSDKPPHTIQRLAELVLYPTKHYKTLPAWLRAVDRVVSVSSAADIFPLSDTPPLVNGVNGDGGGGILWNNNDTRNGYDSNSLGSDESLGGALLTPIPWLRNGGTGADDSSQESTQRSSYASAGTDELEESLTLPSHGTGDPLVPERPDGAVTQGELMRMEQEAGVVPLTQNLDDTGTRTMAGAMDGIYMEDEDLVPHARGPDVVGTVDMGRVGGQNVEIHIGSPPNQAGDPRQVDPNDAQRVLPSTENQPPSAGSAADSDDFEIVLKDVANEKDADAMQLDESESKQEEQDGDIVLVDADGKTEDEVDRQGRGNKPSPDTSTVT